MVPFDCTFWGELDFHMVPLPLVKTRCSLLFLLSFGVYAVYFQFNWSRLQAFACCSPLGQENLLIEIIKLGAKMDTFLHGSGVQYPPSQETMRSIFGPGDLNLKNTLTSDIGLDILQFLISFNQMNHRSIAFNSFKIFLDILAPRCFLILLVHFQQIIHLWQVSQAKRQGLDLS